MAASIKRSYWVAGLIIALLAITAIVVSVVLTQLSRGGGASGNSVYQVSATSASSISMASDFPAFMSSSSLNALGPFNNSLLLTSEDSNDVLGTFQYTIPVGFEFPFFGSVVSSFITITSKGYLMITAPSANVELGLDTDYSELNGTAPNYTPVSGGFADEDDSIGFSEEGENVLSFFHTQNLGVFVQDMNGAGVNAEATVQQIVYQNLPAVNASGFSPLSGSVATGADGERLVIYFNNVGDSSGALLNMAVILYASGLIELRYYDIQFQPVFNYDDITEMPADLVSVGVQSRDRKSVV